MLIFETGVYFNVVLLDICYAYFWYVLIIDREAREIMHLVASVRLSVRPSVRLSVNALTAEPFDLQKKKNYHQGLS